MSNKYSSGFSIACIQTAYANGASTEYLNNIGVQTFITKTGVKHLHKKALDYDVGIYFEANGHGTVLFKPSFIQNLYEAYSYSKDDTIEKQALSRLLSLHNLLNQAIGDAFSVCLSIEAILIDEEMNLNDWNHLYHDLPSCYMNIQVSDRHIFELNTL